MQQFGQSVVLTPWRGRAQAGWSSYRATSCRDAWIGASLGCPRAGTPPPPRNARSARRLQSTSPSTLGSSVGTPPSTHPRTTYIHMTKRTQMKLLQYRIYSRMTKRTIDSTILAWLPWWHWGDQACAIRRPPSQRPHGASPSSLAPPAPSPTPSLQYTHTHTQCTKGKTLLSQQWPWQKKNVFSWIGHKFRVVNWLINTKNDASGFVSNKFLSP